MLSLLVDIVALLKLHSGDSLVSSYKQMIGAFRFGADYWAMGKWRLRLGCGGAASSKTNFNAG